MLIVLACIYPFRSGLFTGETGSLLEGHELFMINVLLEDDTFQAGFMRLLLGGRKKLGRNERSHMVSRSVDAFS